MYMRMVYFFLNKEETEKGFRFGVVGREMCIRERCRIKRNLKKRQGRARWGVGGAHPPPFLPRALKTYTRALFGF